MSLATKCPHCHTTFKVAGDQLKLQTGLVRCGVCQQIFNGIDHLLEANSQVAEPIQSPSAQQGEVSNADLPQKEEQQDQPLPMFSFTDGDEVEEVIILKSGVDDDAFDMPVRNPTRSGRTDLPVQRVSYSDETQEKIASPGEKESAVNKSDANDSAEIEQLSFIRGANTKKCGSRIFLIGVIILLLLLAGQAAYLFRNYIAAIYPPVKKTLVTVCEYVHCQIQLPAQINALSYDAVELHSLPRDNTFEFSLVMRNQSAMTQSWPHIELTLQNALRQPVLRRVFTPAEYLSDPGDIVKGIAAHQEQAVNLYFELDRVKASDYSVAIFYP